MPSAAVVNENRAKERTKERMSEIAMKAVVQTILEKRFVIGESAAEALVGEFVQMGEKREDALDFCEEIVHRAVSEAFAKCRKGDDDEGDGKDGQPNGDGAPPSGEGDDDIPF